MTHVQQQFAHTYSPPVTTHIINFTLAHVMDKICMRIWAYHAGYYSYY